VLQNGVLFRVFTEPYVGLDALPDDPQRTTQLNIRVNAATQPASSEGQGNEQPRPPRSS
jgi:hypothetical protein